jgi:hypothetical protein
LLAFGQAAKRQRHSTTPLFQKPTQRKGTQMGITRPSRIAAKLFLFLSLPVGSHIASAQEGSVPTLDLLEATGDGVRSRLVETGEIGVIEDPRNICILTWEKPEHPEAPFIGRHPMTITSMGVKVGVEGPTPHVGHTSKIVLNPIYNYRTAPTFTVTIRGPHGYHFESPVVMPVEHMEVCEPIPYYPDSCKGPHALTRYHRAELITPAWPHSGMYSIHIGPSESDPIGRRWRGQSRHFEVLDHPLAQHLALPPRYAESSRTAENIHVTSKDSSVYNGPSLVLCGQKRRSNICIRTTNPIPNCQAQLDAGAEPVLHANMASVRAHPEVENDLEASSWCSKDRLLTLYTSRRWGKSRILRQLQEQMPPDNLPAETSTSTLRPRESASTITRPLYLHRSSSKRPTKTHSFR